MIRLVRQFHDDRRGAISVLVLLTLWVLVATLGMLWNTAEYAMRRQHVQAAADSAAHAGATWMARTINAEAAQNMIIAQDASAEVIWRAVPPTDSRITTELAKEFAGVTALINGQDPQYNQQRNNLIRLLAQVDSEFAQTQDALAQVTAGAGAETYPDATAAKDFQTTLRQAAEALAWVSDTYVNGTAPSVPGRPGPPGPNGEGLRQLVAKWQSSPEDDAMLQAILASIQQQQAILTAFEAQTAPATAQSVDAAMQAHESEVFQRAQAVAAQLPQTVEQQRQALANFHGTDLTLATVNRPDDEGGSADVFAPVETADTPPPVEGHIDSIRMTYLQEALDAGLLPIVQIDPINPNTLDDRIWHPDVSAPVPANVQAAYPTLQGSFTVNCNVPGGWGHSWAFPLEQYVSDRVWKDQALLNTNYMVKIDQLRQELAQQLAQLRGMGSTDVVGLPSRLLDSRLSDAGAQQWIAVLPRITAPAGADAAFRQAVTIYTQHAGNYTSRVRSLANALNGFAAYFNVYTQPLAVRTWQSQVSAARFYVLQELGQAKQFMVLSTYGLRDIPDWAREGMRASATAAVRDKIISTNIPGVSRQVTAALVAADPWGMGSGFLDPAGRQQYLQATYSGLAAQIARAIIDEAATSAAPEIAAEMVSRPWPYEMTPPENPVPPSRGMSATDRLASFTLIAASREQDSTAPRLVLSSIFGQPTTRLVGIAQAEAFNWMEFNAGYGADEQFDVVAQDGYGEFLACPRAWRLSTMGGWSWQSKLALADGVGAALPLNDELRGYLRDAGVTGDDPEALHATILH